jgi:uracil-DNA glycosylase
VIRVQVDGWEEWRKAAGRLLQLEQSPDQVLWAENSLFGEDLSPGAEQEWNDAEFERLGSAAACHRSEERWDLLYRVLWRLRNHEETLLERVTDPDTMLLVRMAREVERDCHDMKAYVRFRKAGEWYVAWHRPAHRVVRRTAPFFMRRFRSMNWSILTPDTSAYWDGQELRYGPGMPRSAAPAGDELESLWKTYYANIFNPARVNPRAMQRDMPKRHWNTLPEMELLDDLLRGAEKRVQEMESANKEG